jgi:predicted dinucleotide-binding enzyme
VDQSLVDLAEKGVRRVVQGPASNEHESAANRSPEPTVLFYVTDDNRAGEGVQRLIRTAGFEPVKAGGLEQSGRLEVGATLTIS